MLVASAFDVVAETRDGDGTSWGVLLRWKDHDGRNHEYALPRASLAGDGVEARRILLDGGLFIAPSRKARDLLNSFLLLVRSPTRCQATPHVGWHGNSFVLPDACFGADEREVLLLQHASVLEHCFRQSGTLESWQQCDRVLRNWQQSVSLGDLGGIRWTVNRALLGRGRRHPFQGTILHRQKHGAARCRKRMGWR